MSVAILDAVKQLDPQNDNHWTADGLPRLETVRMLAGDPALTREQVSAAAPDFKRPAPQNNAAPPVPPAAPPAAPSQSTPPAAPAGAGTDPSQEPLEGDNADGLSTDVAEGEAQLPSLDNGFAGDPDTLAELEEALAEETARSDKLRAQADKVSEQLNESAQEQSRLREEIEKVRPRTGTMEAVQGYFAAQDRQAEQAAEMRQSLADSGVDLKALGEMMQSSGLDASALKTIS